VEVARKLAAVADLAEMSEEELRVGGVIDHDFRTEQQLATMTEMAPVFVLGCHEIENFGSSREFVPAFR
ncbi:MAG: hypothetical protein ACREA0_15095, partial [bacterium]